MSAPTTPRGGAVPGGTLRMGVYEGKVVIRDEPYNQIVLFARAIGHDEPLRMTRAQLDEVIEAVLDLKARTRAPVLALRELYDLLISGERPLATGAGWEGVTVV